MANKSDINHTLLELSKMDFEDWATLIQVEERGNPIEINQKRFIMLSLREIKKELNAIGLSELIKVTQNNFHVPHTTI